jgi:hypothetical protein
VKRRGWAYTGALLGGVVSIGANVAHSFVPPTGAPAGWHPHGGAVLGAVFWPVALFVAIEILARTAWPVGKRWVALRYLGLLPVALVAAIVSYRHMSGLLAWYGEDLLTVRIGPLAVDGLMVVAVGALLAYARPLDVEDQVDEQPAPDPWSYSEPGPVTEPATVTPTLQRSRKPAPATTAAQIASLRAKNPDATVGAIAAKVGVSERTVHRHLAGAQPVNGSPVPNLIEEPGGR